MNRPAEPIKTSGFERSVGATFSSYCKSLCIVDIGTFKMTPLGTSPKQHRGVVRKITK